MTNDDYQKMRVFWHECGHYFAQQCIKKLFDGKGTRYLKIQKKPTINQNTDYVGETKHDFDDANELFSNPAAYIASAAYGCIFQCIKYRDLLSSCLGPRGTVLHGAHDYGAIVRILLGMTPSAYPIQKKIFDCIDRHFELLKNDSCMNEIFKEDISDLIESTEDEFFVNLPLLDERFCDKFPLLEDSFAALVNELRSILEVP